tara:strand:+ start:3030 stop:3422 length:393 start_codon:yes stop_codon:yes gene_type:complete
MQMEYRIRIKSLEQLKALTDVTKPGPDGEEGESNDQVYIEHDHNSPLPMDSYGCPIDDDPSWPREYKTVSFFPQDDGGPSWHIYNYLGDALDEEFDTDHDLLTHNNIGMALREGRLFCAADEHGEPVKSN